MNVTGLSITHLIFAQYGTLKYFSNLCDERFTGSKVVQKNFSSGGTHTDIKTIPVY